MLRFCIFDLWHYVLGVDLAIAGRMSYWLLPFYSWLWMLGVFATSARLFEIGINLVLTTTCMNRLAIFGYSHSLLRTLSVPVGLCKIRILGVATIACPAGLGLACLRLSALGFFSFVARLRLVGFGLFSVGRELLGFFLVGFGFCAAGFHIIVT